MAESLAKYFDLTQNENNAILNFKKEECGCDKFGEALINTGFFYGDEYRFRVCKSTENQLYASFMITIWRRNENPHDYYWSFPKETNGQSLFETRISETAFDNSDYHYSFETKKMLAMIYNLSVQMGAKFFDKQEDAWFDKMGYLRKPILKKQIDELNKTALFADGLDELRIRLGFNLNGAYFKALKYVEEWGIYTKLQIANMPKEKLERLILGEICACIANGETWKDFKLEH